jgi:hypothetical protein
MDGLVTDDSTGTPVTPARSPRRSLGSIVLGFEVIIVLLAALVIFGLDAAPFGLERWWALIGGGVIILLLALAIVLLRFEWGTLAGWVLQGIIIASGFLNPAMFFVGALFAGMWWYAMASSARIDRSRKEAS